MRKVVVLSLLGLLFFPVLSFGQDFTPAQRKDLTVSFLVDEMGSATGTAIVDLQHGRIGARVIDMPFYRNRPLPILLTDNSDSQHPVTRKALQYQMWLYRASGEQSENIEAGQFVCTLVVRGHVGTCHDFNLGDISRDGWNIMAINAVDQNETPSFAPESSLDLFTWRGEDHMIVMWWTQIDEPK